MQEQLTYEQWEAVCCRCGRCCIHPITKKDCWYLRKLKGTNKTVCIIYDKPERIGAVVDVRGIFVCKKICDQNAPKGCEYRKKGLV